MKKTSSQATTARNKKVTFSRTKQVTMIGKYQLVKRSIGSGAFGKVAECLDEQGNTVKMPVKHTTYLYKINSATEKLTKELGRAPSVEEISKATDIPAEEIEEVLMASKSYLSLDNYIGNDEDKTFLDSIEDEDSNVEKVIIAKTLKSSIDEIISSLDPREAEIIIKRYGFDGGQPQTLEELGESMGVSRERVRQLENRALEKLKKKALKKRLNDYLN